MTSTMSVKNSEPDRATRTVRGFAAGQPLARLIELLALIPIVTTVIEVARAPRLQFLDYWWVLLRITELDGSLRPQGLFGLQNEHPLVLPSLLYWADAQLFDGENRALGYLVVLLGALTVLALRAGLPATLPPVVRASIVVASSFLIFSLHGLHNFTRSMSGVAWLGANLLVICALLLALRGRWLPAWACALLACLTYGTAFPVWPVLALVATLRGATRSHRIIPLVIGAVVVVTWFMARGGALAPGSHPANDIGTLLFRFVSLVGHLWTAESITIAVIAGVGLLALYGILLTSEVARGEPQWFWWALGMHTAMACGMIAMARVDFGAEAGLFSRYTSVSVLIAIPAIVLLAVTLHRRWRQRASQIAIGVVAAGLLGFTLGSTTADVIRTENREHALQDIAMRAGFTDAFVTLNWPLPAAADLIPRMRAIGHYPFTDAFTLGCGGPELGSTLDLSAMRPMPVADDFELGTTAARVERVRHRADATVVRGWASEGTDPIRCIAIVDANGRITGGGVNRIDPPEATGSGSHVPARTGFGTVGPAETGNRIVFITHRGAMLWLPETDSRSANITSGEDK